MKTLVRMHGLALTLPLVLASCGGGGSALQTLPAAEANNVDVYAGHYVGNYCSLLEGVVNLSFPGDVIGCIRFSVEPLTDKSARFAYRVDFYDGYYQNSPPIGSFSNSHPDNRMEIIGAATSPGWQADTVRFTLHPPEDAFASGNSSDQGVFGTAIRLGMPLRLFQTLEFTEYWRRSNGQLVMGPLNALTSSFFPGLASYIVHVRVPAWPPVPPAPCAATAVEWRNATNDTCSGQVQASPSGTSVSVRDEDGVTTGYSGFECSEGVWRRSPGGSCANSTPPASVVLCSEKSWEWTVEGHTCFGSSPEVRNNEFVVVDSVAPGTQGLKWVQCVQAPDMTWAWTDQVFSTGAAETCSAPN